MAFFEVVKQLGQAIGNLVKPVGGRTIDSFDPDPAAQLPLAWGIDNAEVATFDSAGHLHMRGPVMTDEGSFYDDFAGSALETAIPTGTVTFTNGSNSVTGVGTAFLTELNRDYYIRRTADTIGELVKIGRILSDTELILEEDYAGTSGTGGMRSFWRFAAVGAGFTNTVGGSLFNITAGVGVGTVSAARDGDYLPEIFNVHAFITNRMANQTTLIGLSSTGLSGTPDAGAFVVLDGTVNTVIKFRTQSAAGVQTETTITLPSGLTTAQKLNYVIIVGLTECVLLVNTQEVARHKLHIPPMYAVLHPFFQIDNTAVIGSSTTLAVDQVTWSNQDQVQVTNSFRSDPMAVRIEEETHYLAGFLNTTATTANQVIISTVIPTGKVAYLLGYSCSSGQGGANGVPIKIGRNPPITETSGGAVDGPLFASFVLSSSSRISETFAGNPVPFARGGDTIAATVTPSAATSTDWRASIQYVLR